MERRELLKKAAWIAPAIITLPVTPSMARAGSEAPDSSSYSEKSAWNVIPVVYDEGGLAIMPANAVGAGSWLIYPNKNTYNFQTGKQWVYMGVFGVDAVVPVSFPSLVLGANPIVLVPNL